MIISHGLDLAGCIQSVRHEHVPVLHVLTCAECHVHTQRLAVEQNLIPLLFIAGRDSNGTAAECCFPRRSSHVKSFFLV